MEAKVWNVLVGPFEHISDQITKIKAPKITKQSDDYGIEENDFDSNTAIVAFALLAAYKKFRAAVLTKLNPESLLKE